MCQEASLLVHECTRAAIPESIQRTKKGKTRAALAGAELSQIEGGSGSSGFRSGKGRGCTAKGAGKGSFVACGSWTIRQENPTETSRNQPLFSHVGCPPRLILSRNESLHEKADGLRFTGSRLRGTPPATYSLRSYLGSRLIPFLYPEGPSQVPDLPLTAAEVQNRLIMQSIANQVKEIAQADKRRARGGHDSSSS